MISSNFGDCVLKAEGHYSSDIWQFSLDIDQLSSRGNVLAF